MDIRISGIGTVCALGAGISLFEKGLEGKSVPELSGSTISRGTDGKEISYYKAPVCDIERFLSPRALRRVDVFSQLALLASHLAIEDARIDPGSLGSAGIVFGSAHGPLATTFDFLDTLIDCGDENASPTHFANSVHNAPAAQVSIFLKIKGPCSTLSNFQSTFGSVLFQACHWIEEGRADCVLAGAGEDYSPAEGYAIDVMNGNNAPGNADPLDPDTCGYIPGQGWVTFLLTAANTGSEYCRIGSLALREQLESMERSRIEKAAGVILSAKGSISENRDYRLLMSRIPARYLFYSRLYGSMATGSAFDLAAAALSVKNKRIYASGEVNPRSEDHTLFPGSSIFCIESIERSLFNIYELNS
jgi:3-oxoacyl-[acyl-carrier-protein] synthase II